MPTYGAFEDFDAVPGWEKSVPKKYRQKYHELKIEADPKSASSAASAAPQQPRKSLLLDEEDDGILLGGGPGKHRSDDVFVGKMDGMHSEDEEDLFGGLTGMGSNAKKDSASTGGEKLPAMSQGSVATSRSSQTAGTTKTGIAIERLGVVACGICKAKGIQYIASTVLH